MATIAVNQREICRLCDTPLPSQPEIWLENLPIQAQHFLDQDELATDSGKDLEVYRCTGCGHIQLSSAPVVYSEGVTSTTAFSQAMLTHRKQQMQAWVERFALTGKTVLDVGCGDGHLLKILSEVGLNAIGVDASQKALEIARQHGFTVHYGYIMRTHRIEDGPFDAFVSFDVIEHVPDIKDFLQGVCANLKVGGIGLIETPSFEKVFETRRFYDFMVDHISYFTLDTLRISLEISGFEVLEIERNRDNENLTAIVRKRALPSFEPLESQRDHLKQSFARFMQDYHAQGKRIAIWGASLQTLTLSSLIPMDGITYVIDSAPYKQGKFVPVSHLPIVGPEVLQSDPVEVILVNAPRYEKEIIAQIQTELNFGGTLATLTNGSIEIIQTGHTEG